MEEEEEAKEEKKEEKEEEEQEFGSNLSIPPLPGSHPVQASGVPSPSSLCPTLCPTLKIRDSRWKPSGQKRETTQDIQTSANTGGKEFSVNPLFMTLLQIWNKKLRK